MKTNLLQMSNILNSKTFWSCCNLKLASWIPNLDASKQKGIKIYAKQNCPKIAKLYQFAWNFTFWSFQPRITLSYGKVDKPKCSPNFKPRIYCRCAKSNHQFKGSSVDWYGWSKNERQDPQNKSIDQCTSGTTPLLQDHNTHKLNNEHTPTLCKLDKNVHNHQHGQQTWQTKNKFKVTKQNQIVLSCLGLRWIKMHLHNQGLTLRHNTLKWLSMLIQLIFTFHSNFWPLIASVFANFTNSRYFFRLWTKKAYKDHNIVSMQDMKGIFNKTTIAKLVRCAMECTLMR